MSRVLVDPHHLLSQTCRMIWSLVTTLPGLGDQRCSRSNSLDVRSSSASPSQARRASLSIRTPCTTWAGDAPRRSSARTLARNSASRKGLVT